MKKSLCVDWRNGDGDVGWCGAAAGFGAGGSCWTELDGPGYSALLRKDIRSGRKARSSRQNLTLTDAEATKFWPIYDQYTADLTKISDAKVGGDQGVRGQL